MRWSPNPHGDTIFRDRASKEVIQIKQSHKGEPFPMSLQEKEETPERLKRKDHVGTWQEDSDLQAKERVLRRNQTLPTPWSWILNLQNYEEISLSGLSHRDVMVAWANWALGWFTGIMLSHCNVELQPRSTEIARSPRKPDVHTKFGFSVSSHLYCSLY